MRASLDDAPPDERRRALVPFAPIWRAFAAFTQSDVGKFAHFVERADPYDVRFTLPVVMCAYVFDSGFIDAFRLDFDREAFTATFGRAVTCEAVGFFRHHSPHFADGAAELCLLIAHLMVDGSVEKLKFLMMGAHGGCGMSRALFFETFPAGTARGPAGHAATIAKLSGLAAPRPGAGSPTSVDAFDDASTDDGWPGDAADAETFAGADGAPLFAVVNVAAVDAERAAAARKQQRNAARAAKRKQARRRRATVGVAREDLDARLQRGRGAAAAAAAALAAGALAAAAASAAREAAAASAAAVAARAPEAARPARRPRRRSPGARPAPTTPVPAAPRAAPPPRPVINATTPAPEIIFYII
ncbi:hypothetical protein SO694_001040113 [Aureococcus anophagefferens]|uniref:Uncharacterized protein n=1 Tax=Aureococcus anophagefferens TaxID=44056 RepID=A0ABR1FMH3_AURAN